MLDKCCSDELEVLNVLYLRVEMVLERRKPARCIYVRGSGIHFTHAEFTQVSLYAWKVYIVRFEKGQMYLLRLWHSIHSLTTNLYVSPLVLLSEKGCISAGGLTYVLPTLIHPPWFVQSMLLTAAMLGSGRHGRGTDVHLTGISKLAAMYAAVVHSP